MSTSHGRRSPTASDELDHDAHRHDAGWKTVRSRGVESRPVHHRDGRGQRPPVVVLGPDTATRAVRQRATRRPDGHLQRRQARGRSASSTRSSSSDATSNNDLAIVPLTTYSQRLVGGANRNSVSSIYVKATSAATLSAAYQEAERAAAQPPRDHDRRQRRLLDRDAAVDPQRRHLGRQHPARSCSAASPSSRCSSAASA